MTDLVISHCRHCGMGFRSRRLLEKHMEKFCIGGETAAPTDPRYYNIQARHKGKAPNKAENLDNVLQEPKSRKHCSGHWEEGVNSQQADHFRSIPHPGSASGSEGLKKLTEEFHKLRLSLEETRPTMRTFQTEEYWQRQKQMMEAHERHLADIQERKQYLEHEKNEIHKRLSELKLDNSATSHIEQLLVELNTQEGKNQLALDALREQVELLQESAERRNKPKTHSSVKDGAADKTMKNDIFKSMPFPAAVGPLSSEIQALYLAYLESGGNDRSILHQMYELQIEATALEKSGPNPEHKGRRKKREVSPSAHLQGLNAELLSVELENQRLEDEILKLKILKDRRRLETGYLDTELAKLQQQHIAEIAQLHAEIGKLRYDTERMKSHQPRRRSPPLLPPPIAPPLPPPPPQHLLGLPDPVFSPSDMHRYAATGASFTVLEPGTVDGGLDLLSSVQYVGIPQLCLDLKLPGHLSVTPGSGCENYRIQPISPEASQDALRSSAKATSRYFLDPSDALGPSPYDPASGFAIFYDFLLGLDPTLYHVGLISSLYRNGQELGKPIALPVVSSDLGLSPQHMMNGQRSCCAILAARQPVPRVLPSTTISLIAEIRASGGFDAFGQEIQNLVPRGWAKINIFDHLHQVMSGHWKVPVRVLPVKPGLTPEQLNGVPQLGNAELYLRLVNARDADMQSMAEIHPGNAPLYKYPSAVSSSAGLPTDFHPTHHSFLPGPTSLSFSGSPYAGLVEPPPNQEQPSQHKSNERKHEMGLPKPQPHQGSSGQEKEKELLGFILDRIKGAPQGDGAVRLTGYHQKTGQVIGTRDSGMNYCTDSVRSNIKHGYFIFGEQEIYTVSAVITSGIPNIVPGELWETRSMFLDIAYFCSSPTGTCGNIRHEISMPLLHVTVRSKKEHLYFKEPFPNEKWLLLCRSAPQSAHALVLTLANKDGGIRIPFVLQVSFWDVVPQQDMVLVARFYHWPSGRTASAPWDRGSETHQQPLLWSEEWLAAWAVLRLTKLPESSKLMLAGAVKKGDPGKPLWNTGTHTLCLYHGPVPSLAALSAVAIGQKTKSFKKYGDATLRLHIFHTQKPEYPFPPESPALIDSAKPWLHEAFIHLVREIPPVEPFKAGDGFDLYIDGARFLPDGVTVTKVAARIFTSSFKQIGPDIYTDIDLNSSIFDPIYNYSIEIREPEIIPSAVLLLKVYSISHANSGLIQVGWAALNIFVESGTHTAPRPGATGIQVSLNDGGHQLRIFHNSPCPDQPFSVSTLASIGRYVPCATLLVRLLKAPVNSSHQPLQRNMVPQKKWIKLGLFQPRPHYSDGAYYSDSAKPTARESCFYEAMKNRSVVSVREIVHQLAGRSGNLNTDEEISIWIQRKFTRIPGTTPQTFNLTFVSRYIPTYGIKFAVDKAMNLPWSGLTMAHFCFNPPGACYFGSQWLKYDHPIFTEKLDINSYQKYPIWHDGFKFCPHRVYYEYSTIIIHLYQGVLNPVRHTMSEKEDVHGHIRVMLKKKQLLYTERTGAWTAVHVFSKGYCNTGVYQLPLYQGTPNQNILASLSEGMCNSVMTTMPQKKLIQLIPGASVVVRIADGRWDGEFRYTVQDIDQSYLPKEVLELYNKEPSGVKIAELISQKPTHKQTKFLPLEEM